MGHVRAISGSCWPVTLVLCFRDQLERRLRLLGEGSINVGVRGETIAIRCAGLALIVGVVLAFVAPLFMPGYTFINPVD